jgi:hypothetical protein
VPKILALKGRHRIAQGNALGRLWVPKNPALKGPRSGTQAWAIRFGPYRAALGGCVVKPRAVPWAILLSPFGARTGGQGKVFVPKSEAPAISGIPWAVPGIALGRLRAQNPRPERAKQDSPGPRPGFHVAYLTGRNRTGAHGSIPDIALAVFQSIPGRSCAPLQGGNRRIHQS